MAKSVIGGFQKIPKRSKYREDEWSKERSKKNKPKRDRDKFHNDSSGNDKIEESYDDYDYELEEYN